jgi:uncharacterized protein YecA (UPF0149 family)
MSQLESDKLPPEIDLGKTRERLLHEICGGRNVRLRSMRPKRNDPCLCGSGKKFKQCCWRAFNP